MMDSSYPSWDAICRLCLAENLSVGTKVEIFPNVDNKDDTHELSIPVRIMTCAALDVQASDSLPKQICAECRYQLEKSYYFRKRCQASDGKLRKHIRLVNSGKRSSVFVENSDDMSEDESDNESLQFLREQDKVRQKNELLIREEFKQNLRKQIKEETQKYRRILNKCIETKKEDFRRQLRTELKIAQVKAEIRKEIQASCRRTEKEILLNDLEEFLNMKRATLDSNNVKGDDPDIVNTSGNKRKLSENDVEETDDKSDDEATKQTSAKRRADDDDDDDDDDSSRIERQRKVSNSSAESVNVEQEAATATPTKANENETQDVVDNEETLDVYIIESEEDEANDGEDDNDGSNKEVPVINETAKISDSQTNEMAFNTEQNMNEDSLSDVEFVSYEKKDSSQAKDQFNTTPSKKKEYIRKKAKSSADPKKVPEKHIIDAPITFKCYLCPTSLPTVTELDRHMRNHERVKKTFFVHQCSGSQIYFSSKTDFIRHMDMHAELRSTESSNIRDITQAPTTTNAGNQPILTRKSLDDSNTDTPKTFKCKLCLMAFPTEPLLVRHMCEHQRLIQERCTYQCQKCRMSFPCRISLNRHMIIHINNLKANQHHSMDPKVPEHLCHLCPKRFINSSALSRHIATHSTIAFQCTDCDVIFESSNAVEQHIAVVHGIDPSTVQIEYRPKRQSNDGDGEDDDDEGNSTAAAGGREADTNLV